ncbi:acyltransferase family protein [Streptomyces sp. MMBL 11-3]|uniref:acyltransferase family protein n=1 Tax=Streptomyces sp. MMBL 11-3 TaxID=3382639 RepID=UPI0039B689FA
MTSTRAGGAEAGRTASLPGGRHGGGAVRRHLAALDGLRGCAVAAVLLFHAGRLQGGFLGVDLFFVLSGFLITGILLQEMTAPHGIALTAFWVRRARRLLPALIAVCTTTLLLTWFFGTPAQLRLALDDAPWVAAQAANWHFVAEQVSYWDAGDSRILTHLWSIAVEWQFYLVWPLVVLVAARGRGGERRIAVIAAAGALLSLALMVSLGDAVDTTRAYQGTDTRASALLLGALAATAPVRRRLARVPSRSSDALCALSALGLAASWALTAGESSPGLFQGGMFAHSAACALLIALLAASPDGIAGRLAGNGVLRQLGELSYSLYLWHWPVFLLLPRTVLGASGWGRTAVAIGLSLGAAALTRRWVEDPVRRRAPWTVKRRGAVTLMAASALAVGMWLVVPQPHPGTGTVDVEQLTTR